METKTTQQTTKLQDERAEWLTPAITDYKIEEATLNGNTGVGSDNLIYS